MAVEFVHPVIVGKRALPAFALTAPEVVGQARVVGAAGRHRHRGGRSDDRPVLDLMRRAPAWGA